MKYSRLFFLILVMFTFVANSTAQFKNYSQLISFNGGYASLVAEITENTLDGYAFDFTYEQVNLDGNLSGGIMITYLTAHDVYEEDERHINYQSIPILLQGKYFFGSPSLKFFLQGGIGFQFSRIEHVGPRLLLADGDSGFAAGIGAGVNLFTSEKFFLSAAYNFDYLSNSFYRDGIVHLFKFGLGFQSE